jgi:hypothetical protein
MNFEKDIARLASDISESISNDSFPTWEPKWLNEDYLEGVKIDQFYKPGDVFILQNPTLK